MVEGSDPNVLTIKSSDNFQKGLGNMNDSGYNSPNRMRNLSSVTAASNHDVAHLNSLFPTGLESLEIHLLLKLRELQIHTVLGAIILVLTAVWSAMSISYLAALFFFTTMVAFVLCSVYGDRHRDWRLILGVSVISLMLAACSTTRFFFVASAMIDQSNWSDEKVSKAGYHSRAIMITTGCCQCIGCIFAVLYWGIVAYKSQKLIHLLMKIDLCRSRQFNQEIVTNPTGHRVARRLSSADTRVSHMYTEHTMPAVTTSRSAVVTN